ncbi:hypothetical protein B0T16DRAFT_390433 [Cercophora newfieldiana]|uniref:Uncharacterized protein n=1 Tax=Cercophora newfieldiana TaxID=92897 RepID=A0AA39Y4I5_9PEZI|nr:hypothetical protein B0T16DRAFT_390433 [Cercophora newfieldiana]
MAPVVTPINQYLREQTIENCGFLSVPHAKIYLIVAKEPLGGFKAIAAKAEDGSREALLSESGANVQEALQRLFLRSAEAVQHHITANGFDFAPEKDDDSDFGSVSGKGGDDDGDASTDESLSDNETVSVASTRKANHGGRGKLRQSTSKSNRASAPVRANTRRPRSRTRSPSTARSASVSSTRASSPDTARADHDAAASHVRWRAHPHPGYGMQIRPPHMHTPWRSDPNLSRQPFVMRPPVFTGKNNNQGHLHYGMFTTGPGAAAPPPPPPPTTAQPTNPTPPPPPAPSGTSSSVVPTVAAPPAAPLPATKVFQDIFPPAPTNAKPQQGFLPFPGKQQPPHLLRDVRLRIRFEGGKKHERRILEQMPLTMRGIHNAAAAYLRRQPANNRMWPARVAVRQIMVGGAEYDLSGYRGDDLRPLVDSYTAGAGAVVPEVEVEVSFPPAPAPPLAVARAAGALPVPSMTGYFTGAENLVTLPTHPVPVLTAAGTTPPGPGAAEVNDWR